ncbi:restriction endonuclease subunit S [Treponema succinifaciens]|uniref:restriction endonuclease subunit S n=2 Tax=Treponema succinifaciens TaxID=167 RepID=UPI003F7F6B1B
MSEWKTVRLGDVCEILNGYAFKSDKYVDSGIRVIRITNVQKGFIEDNSPAFYPITEKETLKDYELHENDLLISLTGNVGRVALLSKEMLPAALNQRVGCIRIRDKNLLISYLFTFLNSDKFESDCIYSARGIAQKNMSTEWLKNYLIPLPPIEVQIKIANNLNTCSKIIKKHNKQLNNFDLLIKSRFIEMFGAPDQNPLNWEISNLGNFIENANNGMARRGNDKNGKIVLRLVELQRGFINYSDCNRIAIKTNEEKYLLKNNDFLFARVNGNPDNVGRCSYYKDIGEEVYHNDHIIRVHFDENRLNEYYLNTLLNSEYGKSEFKKYIKTSAGQYTIAQDGISSAQIPIPPIGLQNDFASFVQQIDKSKFTAQKALEEAETLYKSLMQRYFA